MRKDLLIIHVGKSTIFKRLEAYSWILIEYACSVAEGIQGKKVGIQGKNYFWHTQGGTVLKLVVDLL